MKAVNEVLVPRLDRLSDIADRQITKINNSMYMLPYNSDNCGHLRLLGLLYWGVYVTFDLNCHFVIKLIMKIQNKVVIL